MRRRTSVPWLMLVFLCCHVPAGDDPALPQQAPPVASTPPAAETVQPAPPAAALAQVAFRCVEANQKRTGWCGRWELGCRGKGPYRLIEARKQPSACAGETPPLQFVCETPSGVALGTACEGW